MKRTTTGSTHNPDKFTEYTESITQTGKKSEELPLILARKLKKDFPEVIETTQIYSKYGSTFKYGETRLEDPDEEFIDEQYFKFFPRPVICGKRDDILKTLDEIAVTRSFAVKYFKTPEEALGKTLENGYRKSITIVSVLEDSPNNSMMQADVYELDKFDRDRENRITDEKQWALLNTKIYLLLAPNINIKAFEKKINSYIVEHEYNKSILLKLVPLTDVRHTFGSELTFNLSYIRTFTVTGLLLLLCVFFNFTNLLLNRIYLRNKEMKLRNAIGADKKDLVIQLLLELTLLVGISFLLASCLLELTAGGFSHLFDTTLQRKLLFSHLCIIAGISWADTHDCQSTVILAFCTRFFSINIRRNLSYPEKRFPQNQHDTPTMYLHILPDEHIYHVQANIFHET